MEEKIHMVCSLFDNNEVVVKSRTFADGTQKLIVTGKVAEIGFVTQSGAVLWDYDVERYQGYYITPYVGVWSSVTGGFVNTEKDHYKYIVLVFNNGRELTVYL